MSLLTDIILLSDVELSKYINKISSTGATLKNREATKTILKFYKNKQWLQDIRLLVAPEMGLITRDDGTDVFVPTLVGVTDNNVTQTTAASQPYLAGDIAPTEKYALNNTNGIVTRNMQFSQISYTNTDTWNITVVCNYNGSGNSNSSLLGKGSDTLSNILFKSAGANKFAFRNESGTLGIGANFNDKIIGKNTVITFSASGIQLQIYVNGVLFDTITIATNINLTTLIKTLSTANNEFYGKIHYLKIQNKVATDVLDEYNMLRSIFPEIESVKIGSQTWATSNFEAVCTPMGNLIANVTDNTTWSNSKATYDSVYAATSGTVEQKTYAAVKAAAMWCHYNNDVANGAIYGKLYNWYAVKLLQMDIDYYNAANPSNLWGWRVPTQSDFNTLATTLGGVSVAGGKMKVAGTKYWNSPNTGATNESGFTALPSATRTDTGEFTLITTYFFVWSVSKYIYWNDSVTTGIYNTLISEKRGASLRILKN